MFNKVLVALDTEESCSFLFEKALALAEATASDLVLLGVLTLDGGGTLPPLSYPAATGYPLTTIDSAWEIYRERYEAYKSKEEAVLKRYLDQAIAAGIQAELRQETGDPGKIVCDVAKAENADLIIVGSHRRRGLNEFLMGSVSSYVMHRAPCSVLVVHQPEIAQATQEEDLMLSTAN
ncbi:MAG: universal stress protein [Phormidesmis sp.]